MKPIQYSAPKCISKVMQPLLPITKKKAYIKTSYVSFIMNTAYSLSDTVIAGTAMQIDTDY